MPSDNHSHSDLTSSTHTSTSSYTSSTTSSDMFLIRRQDSEEEGTEQPLQPQRRRAPATSASDNGDQRPSLSRGSSASGLSLDSVAMGLPLSTSEQDAFAIAQAAEAVIPNELFISPDDCLPMLDEDELALNLACADMFACQGGYIPPMEQLDVADLLPSERDYSAMDESLAMHLAVTQDVPDHDLAIHNEDVAIHIAATQDIPDVPTPPFPTQAEEETPVPEDAVVEQGFEMYELPEQEYGLLDTAADDDQEEVTDGMMGNLYYNGCNFRPEEADDLTWNIIRQLRMVLLAFNQCEETKPYQSYYRISTSEVNDEMFVTRGRALVEICRQRAGPSHVKLDVAFQHKESYTQGWVYIRHMEISSRMPGLKVRAPGALSLAKFTLSQQDDIEPLMECLQETMEQIQAVMVESFSAHCEVVPLNTQEIWSKCRGRASENAAGSELREAVERAQAQQQSAANKLRAAPEEEPEDKPEDMDKKEVEASATKDTEDISTSHDFSDSMASCELTETSDDDSGEAANWSKPKKNNKKQKDRSAPTRAASSGRRRQRFSLAGAVSKASQRFVRAITMAGRSQQQTRRLEYNAKGNLC